MLFRAENHVRIRLDDYVARRIAIRTRSTASLMACLLDSTTGNSSGLFTGTGASQFTRIEKLLLEVAPTGSIQARCAKRASSPHASCIHIPTRSPTNKKWPGRAGHPMGPSFSLEPKCAKHNFELNCKNWRVFKLSSSLFVLIFFRFFMFQKQ